MSLSRVPSCACEVYKWVASTSLYIVWGRVIDWMPHDTDLQFSSLLQGDPIGSE